MSASRAKGTAFETAVVAYLRERGWVGAERRALNGNRDRGDVTGVVGLVVEVKSAARLELSAWLEEAQVEAANDHADLGVVWIKRRGRSHPARGYVVMDGHTFTELLKRAGY